MLNEPIRRFVEARPDGTLGRELHDIAVSYEMRDGELVATPLQPVLLVPLTSECRDRLYDRLVTVFGGRENPHDLAQLALEALGLWSVSVSRLDPEVLLQTALQLDGAA